MNEVWIGLGGNLGDRASYLARAVESFDQAGLSLLRLSHLYETRPEGDAAEPPYLNAVARCAARRGARETLDGLGGIEDRLGRPREHASGPRTLDLDLLAFGKVVCEEAALTLPHPRLHRRLFVLVPLCELDPHWVHPRSGRTATELLAELPAPPGAVRLYGSMPAAVAAGAAVESRRRPARGG
jgi:2-amino-4-hydroxy-6-hydroxymethyldihydropteridine diphosphokinase